MWSVNADTADLLDALREGVPVVPPQEYHLGGVTVHWWEGKAGDAVVMAEGGTSDDRYVGEQIVTALLEAVGYKRAQFTFDAEHKIAGWPDIMQKAQRLIQSNQVTLLRNGFNNIVAHVIGDHGEYNCEIGRDDPESRTITTWQCECPWDQYAWQRTRKWKKYEGRPCAHVMAAYWKSLATPLDEQGPEGQPAGTGQKLGPPPAPPVLMGGGGGGGGGSQAPAGPPLPSPESPVESPTGAMPGTGMAPPGPSNILPKSPVEQLAEMQPPVPGATPGGMPANPNIVSVPGAKMPSPFNPIQFPGGTYSKTAAEFNPPQTVRLKVEDYGLAEGKSEEHGSGQYRSIPAGSTGEVLGQDPTTGWVEVIFPLHDSSYLEPYHVRMFCDPSSIEPAEGTPFVRRRT